LKASLFITALSFTSSQATHPVVRPGLVTYIEPLDISGAVQHRLWLGQ